MPKKLKVFLVVSLISGSLGLYTRFDAKFIKKYVNTGEFIE